jgi:hypothetical protein
LLKGGFPAWFLEGKPVYVTVITVHFNSPMQNPFSPAAEILRLDINPVDTIHHEGMVYTEVSGCDIWLVQGSEPNQFYVSNALGVRRSQIREDPTDAVLDLLELDPTLLGRCNTFFPRTSPGPENFQLIPSDYDFRLKDTL